MRISKKSVDALTPRGRDSFYWDEDLRGFGVKVTPAGKKVFVLQTRLKGRPKRYTIGPYGQPWSPDAARVEAKRLLGQVSVGIDPHAERNVKRNDISLAELAHLYWEAGGIHKKATTVANEQGLLNRHIIPLLGTMKVTEIQKQHIQKFMSDVAAGKTAADVKTGPRGRARVTGGRGAANRTLGLLSSMLSFAAECDLRPDNPALGTKQFKLRRHDRFLTAAELGRLGGALRKVEGDGASPFAIAAIRFLALTGCRRNEALGLRWDWLDFDHGHAKLPDSKTGQKILVLGGVAMSYLRTLPRVKGSPLVFPSTLGGTTKISIQKIWNRVRSTAELNDLRLHDLRHNFASAAVSSGQSLYLVGKLLGHSQSQTTQRYAHLADDPLKAAADDVAFNIADKLG